MGLSKISLPSGPGSIEGLGSAFEPQLNSGTSSYSVEIAAPPGVAGLQPSVVLRYNSGGGNSPFGLSWNYEPMTIKRQTAKGLPTYGSSDVFVFQGEELVPLSDGSYRMENESGFMRFTRSGDGWEIKDRKGTLYRLGTSSASRVTRPSGTTADDTFAWCVDEVVDVHGNRMEYHYATFFDSPGQLYCEEIRYSIFGPNYHAILFDYEARPDGFSSYLSGFQIKTGRRCHQIRVESQGNRVRRYKLAYDLPANDPVEIIAPNDAGLDFSLLRQVTQHDNRPDAQSSYLPPLRLGYTRFDVAQGIRGTIYNNPVYSLANPNITFADINCDALPDLLYTEPLLGAHEVYYNNGDDTLANATTFAGYPTGVTLDQPGVQLADLDGDNRIDLIQKAGGAFDHFVYFPNTTPPTGHDETNPAWGSEQSYATPHLPFDLSAPDVRSLDLNGDKLIDYMRTTDAGYIYYYNRGSYWEEDGIYLFGEPEMGDITYADDVLFSVPGGGEGDVPNGLVKLADMNGDRLLDLVRLTEFNGMLEIDFWPNKGRGRWGFKTSMQGTMDLGVVPVEDANIMDINGDGLSDVVAVAYDHLSYWINQGNNTFSTRFELANTPEYIIGTTVLRQVDINGNGSTDFLWENWDSSKGSYRIDYFDFIGNAKPNLLAVVDNGIGLRTEIEYKTTTDYYVAAKKGGNPWNTRLPFASTVVSKITQHFGLNLDAVPGDDSYITEMAYYDGYYDTFEKEFRGFAFAKKVERGDDRYLGTAQQVEVNSPSTITRMAFHTGVPDFLDNDDDGQYDEFDVISGYEEESLKGKVLWTETTLLTGDFDGKDNDGDGLIDESDEGQIDGFPAADAVVFNRDSNDWKLKSIHDTSGGFTYVDAFNVARPDLSLSFGSLDGKKVSFAYVAESRKELIEANGTLSASDPLMPVREFKLLRSETEVDFFGNSIRQRNFGEDSPGSAYDDERYSYTIFGFNLTDWIIGLPLEGLVQDEAGAFVSKVRNYYDGPDYLGNAFGVVGSRGLLMRTESFINGPNPVPALNTYSQELGDPRLAVDASVQSSRNRYDAFGNVDRVRDAAWTSGGQGHERHFGYDPVFHTYVETEQVVVSSSNTLASFAVYDYGGGVMLSSTDFNNNQTTYDYDSFFRLVGEVKPGDSLAFPTTEYAYRPADPFRDLYYHYAASGDLTLETTGDTDLVSMVASKSREDAGTGNTFDLYSFTDGAGHKLGVVEEGEGAGELIYKDVKRYTSRGHERAAYLPFMAYSQNYQVPPLTVEHVDLFYDSAGRAIRSVNPPETHDNGARRSETRTVLLPLEIISYDEEDSHSGSQHYLTPMNHFKDGLDRLVGVHELNREGETLETYVTAYDYDLLDNLVRITDAQNNVKFMRYDGLKRRIFMNDLDRGHMTYTFDGQGNVLETTDNKSQVTQFDYDGANRLLSEDYLDAAALIPDVSYHYDSSHGDYPAFGNLQGRLATVEDLSGAEFLSYDARGRMDSRVKRIPDPETGQEIDYASSLGYDSMDRVRSLSYPDGDQIGYTYNRRSLLQSIPRLVTDISYIETDQYDEMLFANGVRTTYEYDPRQRLNDLHTIGSGRSAGLDLLHYAYTFDSSSNIRGIDDLRPGVQILVGTNRTSRHNTQLFDYDDLYRLTGYTLSDAANHAANLAHLDYDYDRIGNMTLKTSPAQGQSGHIDHDERGLTMVNMGAMTSGGSGGSSGRYGRESGQQPGPHALTSTADGRIIDYDDNGNMTDLEGMTLTWDFKDRLVAVENDDMRAEYTYDYSDRRITKHVASKTSSATNTITIYVDKTFELRDYNVPTKYAFTGNARIARFTRMMDNSAPRTQWFRLRKGWNFSGLYVDPAGGTAASVFDLGGAVDEISRFNTNSNAYVAISPSDSIAAGTPYMIHASTGRICVVTGVDAEPSMHNLVAGEQAVVWGQGGGVDPLQLLASNAVQSVWSLSGTDTNDIAQWATWQPNHPLHVSSLTSKLSPDAAVFVKLGSPTSVDLNQTQTDDIRFYHSDHLGSANLITDRTGALVEETAFYPFGHPRNQHAAGGGSADYHFTGKEQDIESGLSYFEARYMISHIGRFISVDSMVLNPSLNPKDLLQLVGYYTYANNCPLVFVDADGNSALKLLGLVMSGASLYEDFSELTFLEQKKHELTMTHITADTRMREHLMNGDKRYTVAKLQVQQLQEQMVYIDKELKNKTNVLSVIIDEIAKKLISKALKMKFGNDQGSAIGILNSKIVSDVAKDESYSDMINNQLMKIEKKYSQKAYELSQDEYYSNDIVIDEEAIFGDDNGGSDGFGQNKLY